MNQSSRGTLNTCMYGRVLRASSQPLFPSATLKQLQSHFFLISRSRKATSWFLFFLPLSPGKHCWGSKTQERRKNIYIKKKTYINKSNGTAWGYNSRIEKAVQGSELNWKKLSLTRRLTGSSRTRPGRLDHIRLNSRGTLNFAFISLLLHSGLHSFDWSLHCYTLYQEKSCRAWLSFFTHPPCYATFSSLYSGRTAMLLSFLESQSKH